MITKDRTIWQQACGDTNRNYSKICLEWDVILNGPGDCGAYPECMEVLRNWEWISSRKITDIWRFAEEMKSGDIVVLRIGTSTVLGVGEIVGEYEWSDCFGDIDGWDIQHVRRVRWLWNGLDTPQYFKTYALKQGDTTQKLTSPDVISWLEELEIAEDDLNYEIKELPKVGNIITHSEIGEYLFAQGVSSNSIEELMTEFNELQRIAKWYWSVSAPSEFETVAYLVVPILRAIGWTPQKMAIEWNKVDIALFDRLPREDENLSIVVEAKKKDSSCLTAISQAQGYAEGKSNCKRLIVTDGLRYGVYLKQENKYTLHAYFNLINLRDNYPVYNCFGVKEALSMMTPDWRG